MTEQTPKVRMLLVDDEEEFLAATSKALARKGLEVSVARSGKEALKILDKYEIDVVVLDVKMPGMDGVEVFSKIKGKDSDLAVIMLTGHGTIAQAFEMSKGGLFDYLTKPCEIDALVAKVMAAAQQTRRGRAGPAREAAELIAGTEAIRVLLVDDEVEFLETMKKVLERRGMEVCTAESGEQALSILANQQADVIVLDVKMPGLLDGLETLKEAKKEYPNREVVLLTGHPTVKTAVAGIQQGAFEYLEKPPDVDALVDVIRRAFQHRQESLRLKQQEIIRDILRRYPF